MGHICTCDQKGWSYKGVGPPFMRVVSQRGYHCIVASLLLIKCYSSTLFIGNYIKMKSVCIRIYIYIYIYIYLLWTGPGTTKSVLYVAPLHEDHM